MTFILYTLWFLAIAVAVNVMMEKVWDRIHSHYMPPRNERGVIEVEDPAVSIGRHRL